MLTSLRSVLMQWAEGGRSNLLFSLPLSSLIHFAFAAWTISLTCDWVAQRSTFTSILSQLFLLHLPSLHVLTHLLLPPKRPMTPPPISIHVRRAYEPFVLTRVHPLRSGKGCARRWKGHEREDKTAFGPQSIYLAQRSSRAYSKT